MTTYLILLLITAIIVLFIVLEAVKLIIGKHDNNNIINIGDNRCLMDS